MLEELSAVAAARGFRCLSGAAYPDGAAPVYWPWVEILRATHARAPAVFRSHIPKDAWALSQLVPELLGPSTTPVRDAHALRFRLFDELTRLLTGIAAETPCFVAIEDLHWADAGSIELLAHCARGLLAQPVLLVATLQDHAASGDKTHSNTLARLSRMASRVALEGLSAQAVASMLEELCADPAADCAQLLHERTQGNPLFIRQLVQLFTQRGQRLERRLLMAAELPPAIRDLAEQRLAGLPAESRQLLAAASVLGPQFDAELLAQLTAADVRPVVALLEPALQFGLLRRCEPTPHRFGFAHTIWRDSLYGSLPLVERGRLHARAMTLLAAQTSSTDLRRLAELAHHSLHALPCELEVCIAHCQRAADAAREASSFESAAELQRHALDKLAAEGGELRTRAELLAQLGLNLFCAGDLSGGFQYLAESARLAQAIAAPDLLAHAASRLTNWVMLGGDREQVRAFAAAALASLTPGHDDELRAVLLARLAELSIDKPREERAELYQQAEALCEHLPVHARFEVALAGVGMRDVRHRAFSLRAADSCRQLLREHAHALTGLRVRMGLCSVALTEYACALTAVDIAAADRAYAQLQVSVEAAHVEPLTQTLEMVSAGRALAEGRQADLRACIERMGAHAAFDGGLGLSALYFSTLDLEARGELSAELLTGFAAQAELRKGLTGLQLMAAVGWFVSAAARAGSHDLARAALAQISADELSRLPVQWGDLGVLCSFASAASELRDLQLARNLYAQLEPYAELNAVGAAFDYAGSVAHFLGQLALTLGLRADALLHLQRAAAVNARLRMSLQQQRTQALLTLAQRV